jgi:hypothetical protein
MRLKTKGETKGETKERKEKKRKEKRPANPDAGEWLSGVPTNPLASLKEK